MTGRRGRQATCLSATERDKRGNYIALFRPSEDEKYRVPVGSRRRDVALAIAFMKAEWLHQQATETDSVEVIRELLRFFGTD